MTTSLAPLDLDLIVKNIGKLPSPSAVIIELLQVIDDEEISSAALAKIITRDPAIVVRMLRIANSSFYGMPGKVESVADAIAILGLRTVRTLAVGAAVAGNFTATTAPGFEAQRFWRHGTATAVGARTLARRMKLGEGAAFVAGLVHDIGQLMLACSFPAHLSAVTEHHRHHGGTVSEAERAVLGLDHADIGGILADRWHFPPAISQAIAHHHHPEKAFDPPLVFAVHLANDLAMALEFPGNADQRLQTISPASWQEANLSGHEGREILAIIEREFAPLSEILLP